MKKIKNISNNSKGYLLVGILVFASIAVLLMTAIIGGAISNMRLTERIYNKERAFHLAEAGNEYYRWHLAHANQDFKDGNQGPPPYLHLFRDKNGEIIGSFTLTITAPPIGSTVVQILSEGSVTNFTDISRKIKTTLAIPSLAKFAVVANQAIRFGEGTEVYGPIHSNDGIRFDGVAHNIVSSARSAYNDPDHIGNDEFGVHTHLNAPPSTGSNDTFRANEAPPSTAATRNDVFLAGRQFPIPAFDFTGITSDLASMKSQAISAGRYFGGSNGQGYRIVLKTNDTFDLYKVTSLQSMTNTCSNNSSGNTTPGWGSWSIKSNNGQQFIQNYPIPSNGIIFVEDNVWVDGQINSARVTIASGRFPDDPDSRPSITINNDLLYTSYTGADVTALISQGDINVGFISDTDLRIDAALIAQNGRVGRYYYAISCSTYHTRDKITLYGMIGTNVRYGFAYTNGTGYAEREINYDSHLLYSPPPSFPLTTSQYSTILWEEI